MKLFISKVVPKSKTFQGGDLQQLVATQALRKYRNFTLQRHLWYDITNSHLYDLTHIHTHTRACIHIEHASEYLRQKIWEHKDQDDEDDGPSRGNPVRSIYSTALYIRTPRRPRPAHASMNSNYYGSPPTLYTYIFTLFLQSSVSLCLYFSVLSLSLSLSLNFIILPQPPLPPSYLIYSIIL